MRGEIIMDTQQTSNNNNNKETPLSNSLLSNNINNNNNVTNNNNPNIKQESPRSFPTAAAVSSDRLKRDEWSEGAVSCLLESYEAKWVLRNRAKLKGQDWEEVARHVSARANSTKSPKTQTQCKNKIESMKKRYRSESAAASADGSSWPLYSRLDLLLRGNNNNNALSHPQPPPPLSPPSLPPPTSRVAANSVAFMMPEPPQPPLLTPPLPPPAPPPSSVVVPLGNNARQHSHGSDCYDRKAKDQEGIMREKLSDNGASERKIATDTDDSISTPAAYRNEKEEGKDAATTVAAATKLMRSSAERMKLKKKKRKRIISRDSNNNNNNWGVAESIRLLAEVVARTEEARTEVMREVERMRAEAEVKRGEMELKRTEIIANTQLEIAKLFASCFNGNNNNNKGVRED